MGIKIYVDFQKKSRKNNKLMHFRLKRDFHVTFPVNFDSILDETNAIHFWYNFLWDFRKTIPTAVQPWPRPTATKNFDKFHKILKSLLQVTNIFYTIFHTIFYENFRENFLKIFSLIYDKRYTQRDFFVKHLFW